MERKPGHPKEFNAGSRNLWSAMKNKPQLIKVWQYAGSLNTLGIVVLAESLVSC